MAAQYIPIKRISSLDAPIKAEKLDGSLFTTENQAHEFIVSVRKNGVKQTVTGSVSGKFIRANGTTIFLQGSIVDGDAVVRLHQDCYNVQGRFTFNIFNTQSGVTTCIYSAVGKIDMGSTETVIDAGDVVPDISDVVAKQEEMTQVIADARTATSAANTAAQNVGNIVARAYSASATYKAGDYCTQNGIVYKAKQDIPSDEEWTASHWTQTVVGDELADLKSAIDQIAEKSYNLLGGILSNRNINSSGVVDTATGSGSDYCLAYATVESGKTYRATTNDSILVYAYFSDIPQLLDSSYDGRHVESSVRTFTAPITGYVAFRIIGADYKAQIVEGTEELPYVNPLTAVDTYARAEIPKESENIRAYVAEKAENTENYIFNYINHRELLDKTSIIEGYYVKASDGTIGALSSFSVTDYIPVLPSMIINAVGGAGGSQVAYYDANKVYVSGAQPNASGFVVPATATIAYMRWCTETTKIPTASLTVTSGVDTFVITGSDSLLHGIISARNGGYKKVLVQAGEYDLISEYKAEFGDDYFDTYAGAYNALKNGYDDRGIWLDDIVITFEPGARVVCNYTGSNADVREYFSCFSVGSNAEIIGLVLDAHNVRYGLHPDFHTQTYEKIIFRHCDLHHVKNNSNFHNNQSIGAGLGVHSTWIVEDCIFRSDTDHPVFRIHNNVSAESESKIVIKNCYITGNGYILLNSYSNSTKQTIATVSGCSWIAPARVGKETEASSDNMTLIAWGNETRS